MDGACFCNVMISTPCSSDELGETAHVGRSSVCACVGWEGRDGDAPELKEVNSISPGNKSALGQELRAIYKERRKGAKKLSQACIQEQSRHQRAENSVRGFPRIPGGRPREPVPKRPESPFLQWLVLTTAFF